jgi:outer membrane lipoprotein-sorting protein
MFAKLIIFLAPLIVFSAPKVEPQSKPSVATILDGIEASYRDIKTLDARFEQSFKNRVFRRTQRSSGRVRFARPGLMEWRYELPSQRRFVLDGKDLWIHQLDDGQVFVRRNYDGDDLKAALRFLWGGGNLRAHYEVSLIKTNEARALLKLVPKKPAGFYSFVRLAVDRKTYRITHSVVVDERGNENRFAFREARYDSEIPKSAFAFVVPQGAKVTELSGAAN